jgi:uncharacterized protein DUF4124
MRRLLALLGVAAVAALATPTHALEVYRWIEGATVVYSDQPPPTGVVLTSLPGREPLPVVTAPDAPPADPVPVEAAPAVTAAVPPPPEPDVVVRAGPATVDEILELSGMRPQLPGIVRALGTEYLPRPGQLSEHDAALIGQVVARHFAAERLYAVIRDDFRRRVDQKQLDTMAVWFRSPIGRRVTALEITASRPEAAPKIAAFAAGLKTSPAPASRLELVQRLDWVTGTSHETTELGLSIAGSVVRAAAAAAPAERRTRAGLVERRVEEMRGQMAAPIGQNILAQMLYVYGPLSDAELKEYVDFLASPPGRAYGRTAHSVLLRVVREAADRTALEVLRAVPPQRWVSAQKAAGATAER